MEILFVCIGHVSYFIKVKMCFSNMRILLLIHQLSSIETAERRSSESAGEGKVFPIFGYIQK